MTRNYSLMQLTNKYLSNLTSLRGVAAIWVAVFHFQCIVTNFLPKKTSWLIDKGYVMVDLFFIMSGFIICHVYKNSFVKGLNGGIFRKFLVARFARVYPLHIITLLIMVVIVASAHNWDNMMNNPNAIATNIVLLHSFGIHKVFTWNFLSWSISAEWWAYMIFPVLVIMIYRRPKIWIPILSVFVLLSYIALMFWLPRQNPWDPSIIVPHNLDVTYDYGYLRGLAGFISGMLLYRFYETGRLINIFEKDLTGIILIAALLLALHIGINDGFYILLFIPLVFAFALNKGKIHALCNTGPVLYMGKISYSIYLSSIFPFLIFFTNDIKLPGVTYTRPWPGTTDFWVGFGYCLIFLVILTGLASLTYYTVERPFRKFINEKFMTHKPDKVVRSVLSLK
jgi:peptidoglycan/LPS O-acetylase OafA/YrhL